MTRPVHRIDRGLGMPGHTSTEAAQADAPDRAEILHAIGLYADGFNHGDASKFGEAVHEDAWIYFIAGGAVSPWFGGSRRVPRFFWL